MKYAYIRYLLFAGMLLAPLTLHAAVGKVMFAFGEVSAVGTDGNARKLSRGDGIESGDLLKTLNGRMQVRFSDGGFVALQPRTEFKVTEYRYAGREDGNESAVFNLLRGGIRAVTGLIGRRNKNSYRVDTAFATIGIRGTAYTALTCSGGGCVTPWGQSLPDGLYTKTGDGIIFLRNNAGIIDLPIGSGGFVANIDAAPVETSAPPPTTTSTIAPRRSRLKSAEDTESTDQAYNQGAQYGAGGGQESIIGDTNVEVIRDPSNFIQFVDQEDLFIGVSHFLAQPFPGQPPVSPSFGAAAVFTDTVVLSNAQRVGNAFTAVCCTQIFGPQNFFTAFNSSVDRTGSTSDVLLERFSNGVLRTDFAAFDLAGPSVGGGMFKNNQSFYVAAGRPIESLPKSGMATYRLAGASRVSRVSGQGPLGQGATANSQLNVDFTSARVNLFLQVKYGPRTYQSAGSNIPIFKVQGQRTRAFAFQNQQSAFANSGPCNIGCSAQVEGFFTGQRATVLGKTPNAAGLTYTIFESDPLQGAAAFRLVPASVQQYP